ncbi:MAG: hypothetical protein V2I79_02335 [Xanthomonadales bacterium]|jgi:hypothetical protein|nr:hypothetical protein [Xanthomonadales bacterium]
MTSPVTRSWVDSLTALPDFNTLPYMPLSFFNVRDERPRYLKIDAMMNHFFEENVILE